MIDFPATWKTTFTNISEAVFGGHQAAETPKHVSKIQEWIQACNELHGDVCVPKATSQRSLENLPSWLIDMHQLCIVPGVSSNRYLALSYVWPEPRNAARSYWGGDSFEVTEPCTPPPRTLLLDESTLSHIQNPQSLSSKGFAGRIPAVIKYAMELTLALEERYLWVDRLCIVQDDLGIGGTTSQVAKMDKIYAGAYLTIIAAAREEMYYQTLTEGWPEFWSYKFTELHSRADIESGVLSDLQIARVPNERYRSLARSKWASRGWYQEQILCGRSVAFVDDGFLWDCQCCVWDAVDLDPSQMTTMSKVHSEKGQRILTRWWPDFSLYLDLVCPFNGREFSYPQDALAGFQGIINTLERSFPGGFLHGMPRLFLDHALLWQPFGMATRRKDRRDDDIVHSSLPSWSWCGWEGFIDPWSLRSGLSYIDKTECRKQAGSWITRSLVEWQYQVGGEMRSVNEPLSLDRCVRTTSDPDVELPYGWTRHERSLGKDPLFFHEKDLSTFFRHPLPIHDGMSRQSGIVAPGYLTCTTTTASFNAASYLRKVQPLPVVGALPKMPVFENPIFERGPTGGHCPILVLQSPNGAFAGLLRLPHQNMPDWEFVDGWKFEAQAAPVGSNCLSLTMLRVPYWNPAGQTVPIELIAISTGSASATDMRASMEWRIFETGRDTYEHEGYVDQTDYEPAWINDDGKPALLSDITTAFSEKAARQESPSQALRYNIDDQVTEQLFEEGLELSKNHLWDELLWFETRNVVLRGQAELLANEALMFQDPEADAFGLPYRIPSRDCSRLGFLKQSVLERTRRNGLLQHLLRSYSTHQHSANLGNTLCEFYNVLWIERRDGIAYRRACGWVPKYIWEAHATGPVEVKLG